MDKTTKLIEHRKLIKKRKPEFIRQDYHKISNLGKGRKKKQVWRAAKGRHSKVRQMHKGRRAMPTIGYRSPKLIRGTTEGKKPVMVYNVHDLMKVGQNDIAIIASVGLKKKIEILKRARELKIQVSNIIEKRLEGKVKKRDEGKKLRKEKVEQKKKFHAAKDQERAREKEREKEEKEEKQIIATQPVEEKRHDEHVRTKENKPLKRIALEK